MELAWGQNGDQGHELSLSINGPTIEEAVIEFPQDGFIVPDNTQLVIGHNHLTQTQPPFQVKHLTIEDTDGENFVDTDFSVSTDSVTLENLLFADNGGGLREGLDGFSGDIFF